MNLVDNLSVVSGRHQLKFGVDYRWLGPVSSPFAYRQFVQFSGVTAAPGGALSGTAAFVQPAAFQENALRSQNFSLYGQDTWNITPPIDGDVRREVGRQPAAQRQGLGETIHSRCVASRIRRR